MGHDRGAYPSDLTDKQWELVEPLLPPARVGPKGGRREKHPRRRIVDAILYVVRTGCSWRQLPNDFAPWPTVYWYFTWWHDDGTVERIHDALRGQVREADGRNAEPSTGLIDSQSVRTADTVPAATRGFDAGKKVKGRKRFIVTDTLGCSWPFMSSRRMFRTAMGPGARCCGPASTTRTSGRSGGPGLRRPPGRLGRADPRPRGGDRPQGPRSARIPGPAEAMGGERTFSWLTAHRRPARDYEASLARSETMIRWAIIGIMVRRLTRTGPATRPGPRALTRVSAAGQTASS